LHGGSHFWCASLHDDSEFADLCLRDSFDRAGLSACLPAFRRYVAMVHGDPAPCPPAARLGCWLINTVEARTEAARAMLALGEIADSLSSLQARVRAWDAPRAPA
jgi:hypothetical protein